MRDFWYRKVWATRKPNVPSKRAAPPSACATKAQLTVDLQRTLRFTLQGCMSVEMTSSSFCEALLWKFEKGTPVGRVQSVWIRSFLGGGLCSLWGPRVGHRPPFSSSVGIPCGGCECTALDGVFIHECEDCIKHLRDAVWWRNTSKSQLPQVTGVYESVGLVETVSKIFQKTSVLLVSNPESMRNSLFRCSASISTAKWQFSVVQPK